MADFEESALTKREGARVAMLQFAPYGEVILPFLRFSRALIKTRNSPEQGELSSVPDGVGVDTQIPPSCTAATPPLRRFLSPQITKLIPHCPPGRLLSQFVVDRERSDRQDGHDPRRPLLYVKPTAQRRANHSACSPTHMAMWNGVSECDRTELAW